MKLPDVCSYGQAGPSPPLLLPSIPQARHAPPPTPATPAERYTYDLVQVANPSIDPSTATAGPDTFTLVHDNLGTPTGIPNSYSTTTNTFYLTGLPDGLYRLRVKSVIGAASEASAWSDVIGTGEGRGRPVQRWLASGRWAGRVIS